MADSTERRDRFLLKQANKIMGRQGQTIHSLRAELAEVRSLISKSDRGDLRRYERQVPELQAQVVVSEANNEALRERIKELENPIEADVNPEDVDK